MTNCDRESKKFIIRISFSVNRNSIKNENDESSIKHLRKSDHEDDKNLDATKTRLCDFTNRTQSISIKTRTNRTF